jgi:hypothetical protein
MSAMRSLLWSRMVIASPLLWSRMLAGRRMAGGMLLRQAGSGQQEQNGKWTDNGVHGSSRALQ